MLKLFLCSSVLLQLTACSGSSSGADAGTGNSISGTLGTLGAAQPIVSAFNISNSGETLIYLSSGALTCQQLTVSRWLGGTTAGTQVVEIVFQGAPVVGNIQVPPGEVNYAPGGMSSAFETNADSGMISLTTANVAGTLAGSFTATYGSDSISGQFNATYCANGQDY